MLSSFYNAPCPRLWDSAFIDHDGRVYACCHYLPESIGNINETTLEHIRHGSKLHTLRQAALKEGTKCFSSCSILSREEKQAALNFVVPEHPVLARLHILFGEGCSLACIMCHQNHKSASTLSAETVLASAVPDFNTSIEIQGGEPLQLKESRKYLAAIVEQGWAPTVITNGIPLSGTIAEIALRGCSRIKISLNAATGPTHESINIGSSWTRVITNIRAAVSMKKELVKSARLIGHMTIVTANLDEISMFIPLCADLGLDAIEFGYDARNVPQALSADLPRQQALKTEISAAYARYRDLLQIQTHRLQRLGLWDGETDVKQPTER